MWINNGLFVSEEDSPEIGALPSAPKNAPACKTETTFPDKFASLLASTTPLVMIPKCSSKYFCETTLPATPLCGWRRVAWISE